MGLHFAGMRFVAPPLLVGAIVVACGTAAPPVDTSGFGIAPQDGGANAEGAPPSLVTDPGAPSCDGGTHGNVCGCLDLDLLSDPPNIYFVLDRSGSMLVANKWLTIRQVIASVIANLGPRAKFGAAMFPNAASDACSVGGQVMPMTLGNSPAGTYGSTVAYFTEATNVEANGGTPTAATLQALLPILSALPGKTYVILATDGGPNCNDATTCDASACTPNIEGACLLDGGLSCCDNDPENCLDTQATVAAVAAIHDAGIPTYVVGVPGSGPYMGVLNQMAQAGGTPRSTSPYYYAVSSTDQSAFATTLATVAAQVTATCTLTLSAAPPDPTRVNLYLDGALVPEDPVDGWTLSGSTVSLVGTTCAKVRSGEALSLRIVAGCPTVLAIGRKR